VWSPKLARPTIACPVTRSRLDGKLQETNKSLSPAAVGCARDLKPIVAVVRPVSTTRKESFERAGPIPLLVLDPGRPNFCCLGSSSFPAARSAKDFGTPKRVLTTIKILPLELGSDPPPEEVGSLIYVRCGPDPGAQPFRAVGAHSNDCEMRYGTCLVGGETPAVWPTTVL